MRNLTDKQKQAMQAARDRLMGKFTPAEREKIKDICAGLTPALQEAAFVLASADIRNVICLVMDGEEVEGSS